MNSFKVHFHGVAAHGAAAPHMGKSALDGAVLMDVGVNYLREHVEQEVRMHSVITDGGGAPNIVPPQATIWYYCRAPKRDMVDRVFGRMLDIAKGAAMMSDTTYDVEVLTACHELVSNNVVNDVMQAHMVQLGGPGFSAAERAFATELQKSIAPQVLQQGIAATLLMAGPGVTAAELKDAASEIVVPALPNPIAMPGSSDVGDVSKIVPTGFLTTCTTPIGTPGHSWQQVAASGSDMGARGTVYAAKVMALAALDFATKPELIQQARAELVKSTGGKAFQSALPADAYPHY
jgi:aminobenzoyl-glutamate utilization protein B